MKVTIKANEYYLPFKKEDVDLLKKENPDWDTEKVKEKTGINTRYISGPQETATDMAVLVAEKLLAKAEHKRKDIESIILVTQSSDYTLPTSACILQERLRLSQSCMAFDVNLGCSGFVYGLAIGGSLIESGLTKTCLLICSETYTKYLDKTDRTCRPLFSDAAAATLLISCKQHALGPFEMGTDGSGFDSLIVHHSGARNSTQYEKKKLFMNGPGVFMFSMDKVPKCVDALLSKSKKTMEDIDLFIFHQANRLVIDNIIRRLNLPKEKVFINYDKVGNTVSASIPIALKEAMDKGSLKKNDLVMLVGFGVGYSWGGCLIRWGSVL